jgi:Tfp pilus assembly protein PilN
LKTPLNLASRPFRNERLPALALGLAVIALLGLSVQHALLIRRLLPRQTSALGQEVATLTAEMRQLRAEALSHQVPGPEPAVLRQWTIVRSLVDRRAFSWTDLFASLEQALPPGVRLVSIAPDVKPGYVRLELVAVARNAEEGLGLVRALEARPEFRDVYPLSADQTAEGGQFTYSLKYVPPAGVTSEGPSPRSQP